MRRVNLWKVFQSLVIVFLLLFLSGRCSQNQRAQPGYVVRFVNNSGNDLPKVRVTLHFAGAKDFSFEIVSPNGKDSGIYVSRQSLPTDGMIEYRTVVGETFKLEFKFNKEVLSEAKNRDALQLKVLYLGGTEIRTSL